MKATEKLLRELRVGNYIKGIDGIEKLEFSDLEYYFERYYRDFEIEPIELTEEWLLKMGFKCIKVDRITHLELIIGNMKFLYFDNIIQFGILGVSQFEWSSHVRIQYVHQLQNLYHDLTGEELTIK